MDTASSVLVASGAVSGACYLLFKWLENGRTKSAGFIEGTRIMEASQALSLGDTEIPFGCVRGHVATSQQPLTSLYLQELQGVVKHFVMTEHKSKRVSGAWVDQYNTLRDVTETVPFGLSMVSEFVGNSSTPYVHVEEIMTADMYKDAMTVTFDKYQPTASSAWKQGVDRIFGEVVKGHQETERILALGTQLFTYGRIVSCDGRVSVGPAEEAGPYIVTRLSQAELVKKLMSSGRKFRYVAWFFGGLSFSFVFWALWRYYKMWKEKRAMDRLREEVRANHPRPPRPDVNAADAGGDGDNSGQEGECVVCLTNARNIVLLNCGHICMCLNCYELLPVPKKCPMCRERVNRALPVYRP